MTTTMNTNNHPADPSLWHDMIPAGVDGAALFPQVAAEFVDHHTHTLAERLTLVGDAWVRVLARHGHNVPNQDRLASKGSRARPIVERWTQVRLPLPDSGAYNALVTDDPHASEFVRPLFPVGEVERMRVRFDELAREMPGSVDTLRWAKDRPDVVELIPLGCPGNPGVRIQADERGLYAIGTGHWTWEEVKAPEAAVDTTDDDTPPIRKMLDLATVHLPEEYGRDRLAAAPGVTAYELTYGWLMWVPDDPADSSASGDEPVPTEILAIQTYARRHGCDYVLFDADADTVSELPTWDW